MGAQIRCVNYWEKMCKVRYDKDDYDHYYATRLAAIMLMDR